MTPQRIQRKRTKGWRMPQGALYVGRPSRWANPFPVGGVHYVRRMGVWERIEIPDRATAVSLFEEWASKETVCPDDYVRQHVYIRAALANNELAGKDLACWCPLDQPCHADVLLRIANEVTS